MSIETRSDEKPLSGARLEDGKPFKSDEPFPGHSTVYTYPLHKDHASSENDEVRIFLLYPGFSDDSVIEGRLVHTRLSEGFPFSALSYTWGNPYPETWSFGLSDRDLSGRLSYEDRVIVVNDTPFKVTANLFYALRRIRSPEIEQHLWVDAICVDQFNLAERASQVRLMRDIYRNAKEVVIWLGEEEGSTDSGIAIDLLQYLAYYENSSQSRPFNYAKRPDKDPNLNLAPDSWK